MTKLEELADACFDGGACNLSGLIHSLGDAVKELKPGQYRDSLELKIIIGQFSFLLGESAGPSGEAAVAWELKLRELKNREAAEAMCSPGWEARGGDR